MVTRKLKTKKTADHSLVRTLIPKDAETKYVGDEPFFPEQPVTEYRSSAIARGLNWYNRFYGRKDARDMMADYLDFHDRNADGKIMRKVDDTEFRIPTFAWLARLSLRGLELTEHEMMTMENEITRLLHTIHKPVIKVAGQFDKVIKTPDEIATAKTNIQETMRLKASEAAGELEGMLDEFHTLGSPTKHIFRPIDEVSKKNVLVGHVGSIREIWERKLVEMNKLIEGKDAQLVEAYSFLNKHQIKNRIKFIELVLSELNSYISVKKTTKAPRARKEIPVTKIVAKFKHLKVYKDEATKLDLIGVNPAVLHGASEAYIYDTAKRRLTHLVADEYSKTFTVKGSTVLGFDAAKSEVKTLRKPATQLKEIMGGKPAARKFFADIRSVAVSPTGRSNANMLILRAF